MNNGNHIHKGNKHRNSIPISIKQTKSKPSTKRQRRSSKLQQITDCTRLAVSHLCEKVSPITPHLHLLNEMCSTFISTRDRNVFETLETKENKHNHKLKSTDSHTAIGEIGVSYIDFEKTQKPPEHYIVLDRSVSGQHSGNLAKHGSRKTYLFFRHINQTEKPITAISLIDVNNGEEPPLGFELITQTPGANDANLTFKQKNNSCIHLCVYRGIGPPLTHLGIVHIGKKEKLPIGWHFISRTSNGKSPDLDSGNTILGYKRNYYGIINKFKKYVDNTDNIGQQLIGKCIACLVCGIYSFDRQVFLHALEAFTILEPIEEFPSEMLSDFICIVRDSITAYISFFNREIYSKVLKWAYHVYDTRCTSKQIDSRGFINLLHLCMFLRYDDVREEASMGIINKLIIEWSKYHDNNNNIIKYNNKNNNKNISIISPLLSPIKLGKSNSNLKVNTYDAMNGIICGLINYVAIVKITESDVTKFLNIRVVDEEFNEWVIEWMNKLYKGNKNRYYDQLMSCTMILFSKICSQELPLKLTAKSETIKRRIHAMKLLSVFLSKSKDKLINDKCNISLVLLRRVIFQSFIYNAITPIPALFKKMLVIFKILWNSYRIYLKFEIGVLLDIGIIGLLQSKYCTSPQKIDLLRGLLEIFQNRGALINIFYNYDNDLDHWPICNKLVLTLSKLTDQNIKNNSSAEDNSVMQHSLMLLSRFMQLISKYLKAPHLLSGGNIDEQENFDSLGGGLEAMLDHINGNRLMLMNSGPSSNALLSLYSGISGKSGISSSNVHFFNENTNTNTNTNITSDVSSVSSFGSNKIITLPTVKEASKKKKDSDNNYKEENKYAENDINDEELKEFDVPQQPSIFLDDTRQEGILRHMGSEDITSDFISSNDHNHSIQFGRRSSAISRHQNHIEENMIIAKALKKARTEKLKTGIKFLLAHNNHPIYKKFSTLEYIAEFLYTNGETLDLVEIGDFISALETKTVFNESEHAKLLMLYVSQLNFTGQSFDNAFRHFLTDSGYRLPKEAQKIERLLIAFSHVFIVHNPHYFSGSNESALFLAYGMLMLNTELHDPRIKNDANLEPMTKQQFYKLLSGGNKKLDKKLLYKMYDSVKENPIQMEIAGMESDNFGKYKNNNKQRQFRKECISLVNKSLGKLRLYKYRKHHWQKARQKEIVKTLYNVTWMKFLGSITTILEHCTSPLTCDAWTQSICLDAIKYCSSAAICLHLSEPELYAFLCDLAKFVFIEQNKHLIINIIKLQIIRGEHLKQEWFTNILNYSKTHNMKIACQVVSHICNDMKCKILYDANQKILRDIEIELNNCVYLVHPDRKFIFSGPLTKQSTKGELNLYKFYLFSDLLIYVSSNNNSSTSYNVHRVLHLSLCKIKDLSDGFIRGIKNSFRIISPQKNIILIAETNKEKYEWFQLIDQQITKQIDCRERWINENYQTLQEYHQTARCSKYLGRNSKPKKHELNRVQNGKAIIKNIKELNPNVIHEINIFFKRSNPCKLCSKPFKRFTRKTKCPWCLDIICKECMKKKIQLPEKKNMNKELIKVCDSCYGNINYFINDLKNHQQIVEKDTQLDLSSIRR